MAEHVVHNESIYIAGVFPTITALKAVNTTSLPQFIWAYVEETNTGEYYLDLNATDTESLPGIVAPTTGGGRWFRKDVTSLSSNNIVKKIADASVSPNSFLLFNTGYGIDVNATGGSDVLNIGSSNADIINIGHSSSTVNIQGTLLYENVTNLEVTDKLITLNKGGAASSAVNSGIEFEEDGTITGWLTTDGSRNGFEFKAPGASNIATIDFSLLTGNRTITFPDATGTLALTSDISSMISDSAYGPGWNGSTNIAPSQNAVYDQIETINASLSNYIPYSGGGTITDTINFTPNKGFNSTSGTRNAFIVFNGTTAPYDAGTSIVTTDTDILSVVRTSNFQTYLSYIHNTFGNSSLGLNAGQLTLVAANGSKAGALEIRTSGTNSALAFMSDSTAYVNLNTALLTAERTIQFPDASGTLALLSDITAAPVTSVFGRTGVVVAAANDYTFAQIGSKPTTISGYGITDAVSLTGTQTLTNKTLTSPVINVGSDATGDIYYRDASGIFTRLPIGTSSQVLIGGSAPSYVSVATALGYTPLNKAGDTMTGLLVLSGDPVSSLGAVTKQYVDNYLTGLTWKQSVVAATTANITLSGSQTIDGVSVTSGDRVLVKNQTTATENGIYVAASGAWSRATDNDSGNEIATTTVLCEEGTVNGGTQWNCSNTIVSIGSTNITFVKIAGAGVYSNGTGILLSANVFSIDTSVVTTLTGTQTLTNKTLTSPKINSISDTNGAEILRMNAVGSSVNWIDLYNANTGAHPKIGANGSDTNVNLFLESKGTNSYVSINTSTALRLANGTTSERPSSGLNGMLRYNTTTNKLEGYENGSWINISSGTPAGSNTQIQFNNAGSFGADSNLTWDNTNKYLGLGGITPNTRLDISGDLSFRKSDSSVTGSNDNVSTANISNLRFTNNTGPTITGFANGFDGKILTVTNSGSGTVTLSNNSGSSLAANRIISGSGSDITIVAGASLLLQYDSGGTVWRVLGNPTFQGTPITSTGTSGRVAYWSGSSSLSSSANYLFDTTLGGRLAVGTTSNTANLNIGATATATGTNRLAIFTGAAHTNQTLSTEITDINFNLARTVQWATGAISMQRAMLLQAPTYSFVGSSTITTAATFAISGAPVSGTNATITNPYALLVQSGNTGFQGSVLVTDTTLGSPNVSCLIDLVSTSKGLGLASMTTAQKNAIASPRNGLMIYQNDGTQGVQTYVNGAWVGLSTAGSSSVLRTYQFSMLGEANSTNGYLTKASDTANSTSNPSGSPTTTSGNPGINNGVVDPYIIPKAATITSIRIKIAGASVGTGTVGTPTLRLRVYRVDYSTRTQLGSDIDITLSATGIGTFNNTAGNGFQTAVSSALSISVAAGDLIGVEFVNQSGTNNGINAVSRLFAVMETSE